MADIVDLGAFKLQRKHASLLTSKEQCPHKSLQMEEHGQIVRCADCQVQVSAWWALGQLAAHWGRLERKQEQREDQLKKAMETNLHLVAARKVEAAWRSRKTVPACPHCNRGILPEDNLGSAQVSREMELRRRNADHARAVAALPPANPKLSDDST